MQNVSTFLFLQSVDILPVFKRNSGIWDILVPFFFKEKVLPFPESRLNVCVSNARTLLPSSS